MPWPDSRFTGLFASFARLPLRPHDPRVFLTAGETPPWHRGESGLGGGGASWTPDDADGACIGEAVERLLARALPCDGFLDATFADFPLTERAVDPSAWVLYHPEQYDTHGFPFAPLTPSTPTRWTCFRDSADGEPVWVPEELAYLVCRRGGRQRHAPGFSTGLSCGPPGHPTLFRGAQEVVERDALMGMWWGRYPVRRLRDASVWASLGDDVAERVRRPNLSYAFYRVESPFSDNVTLTTLHGPDHEGDVYSVGTACRETVPDSLRKSLLEAIQGRHAVRRLLQRHDPLPPGVPTTFFDHALFHALRPDVRSMTVLAELSPTEDVTSSSPETLAALRARLGPSRPVLFRDVTPPGLPKPCDSWRVLRVVVPGLQPMHGDHRLPFLGGPLWRPRGVSAWESVPPHPFA